MPFVTLSDRIIPYQMQRSKRAKQLRIELAHDHIKMVVPHHLSNKAALGFFFSKKKWILKHWQKEKIYPNLWPTRWEKGARIYFLGHPLLLDIVFQCIAHKHIVRKNQALQLIFPQEEPIPNEQNVRTMVINYLKQQAYSKVAQTLEYYCPILHRWPTGYKLKQTKRRWGSCGVHDHIYINWSLIVAPEGVLNYVVIHELCHLFYRNHGSKYWKLVEKIMPQYQKYEKWLREHGDILALP